MGPFPVCLSAVADLQEIYLTQFSECGPLDREETSPL